MQDTAPTVAAPRGSCGSCKFFIDDPHEVQTELAFLARQQDVLLSTERVLTGKFIETHGRDGTVERVAVPTADGRVEKTVQRVRDLAAALWTRYGVKPDDLGLCDKGVVDITTRGAGPPTHHCRFWIEGQSSLVRIRPAGWREWRDEVRRRGGLEKIRGSEPCPCKSGKRFGRCHGRANPLERVG